MLLRMLSCGAAITSGDIVPREGGADTRGSPSTSAGAATSATNNATATAAVAREIAKTCQRRTGSDVAPSRSSITSAQPVRELRELRHAERARRPPEDGLVLDPADRGRAVDRERRLGRAAAHPQRRVDHQR